MKANLLRSVSHDLRTPLTSIIGSSSAVLENYDEFDDAVKKDLIGHVREDAQWLKQLVENILSITRMKNGPAQIVKFPEAAEEIAAEAVTKFKKLYPEMTVRVSVPEELMMVPMDAVLIEQVLINLMENAVRHGEYTSLIELSIAERGEMAVFAVKDNGCGIDKAIMPKLFDERFPHAQERGDTTRSLGIGLTVCMSIVKAHGGEMSARNRTGGGACVSFALPMKEE
jgi:two-component system sensor histidine kinase KdpD